MPALGDLNVKLILEIITAEKNADIINSKLHSVEVQANKTKQSFKDTSASTKELGESAAFMGAGFAAGISAIGLFLKSAIEKGAAFDELSKKFKGTAEDIELFRKATASTETDGTLIAISNHASSLNVNLDNQAKLFYLAKKASEEFGGGVEQNFLKILNASDGSTEGLRAFGITVGSFKEELNSLTTSTGKHLNALSSEEQQNIRLQAIFNLTGASLESINNKTQTGADKLKELSNVWDNFTTSLGLAIVQSGELGKGMDGVTASVQSAGQKSGNFISTLISLGSWIQSVTSYIYPWIGAYNALSGATQFAIDKIKELMSTQSAQRSQQQFKFQYGDEGNILLDEFGNPIPPKSPDAERSKYQNSKGTLGYKDQKDSGGNSRSKSKDAKEFLTYLQEINKELTEINDKIARQSTAESEAEGLFAKKKSLEFEVELIHQINTGFADYIKLRQQAATLPGAFESSIMLIPEDAMLKFRILLQDQEKANRDTSKTYEGLVSDLTIADTLISDIANKLPESGKSFLSYMKIALQAAIQIAQFLKKSNSKEGAGVFDFLPIIGTILGFIPGFASGTGSVPGPGNSDSTLAMLTPGEGILNRLAMSNVGSGFVNWLNGGGSLSSVTSRSSFAGMGSQVIINLNGELTDHLKHKIVSDGNTIVNVRKANSNY